MLVAKVIMIIPVSAVSIPGEPTPVLVANRGDIEKRRPGAAK